MKYLLQISISLLLSASVATAASQVVLVTPPADSETFLNTGDLKWDDAPPSLPKGARLAVLRGDPTKPGAFVMRLSTPGEYKIPPHWHSKAENLTVVSGTLYLGDGDKLDPAHAHALDVGGFHYLPAKSHHFAFTKTPTVVQIHGQGPFDIFYINQEDDPQRQK